MKNCLLNFIKTRNVGFYLLCAITLLSVLVTIIYSLAFGHSARYGLGEALFPLLTLVCLLITIYKPIERYASIAMNIVTIFSLLLFLSASYMHFGDTFFSVQDDMPTNIFVILGMLGFPYTYCLIALILNIVISFIALFVPISRKSKEGK